MPCFASGSCVGWWSVFKLSVNHTLGCSQSTKSYSSAQMGKLRHGWISPPQGLVAELAMGPGSLWYGSLSTGPLSLSFCSYRREQRLPFTCAVRARLSTGSKISGHSSETGIQPKEKKKRKKPQDTQLLGKQEYQLSKAQQVRPVSWVLSVAPRSSPR